MNKHDKFLKSLAKQRLSISEIIRALGIYYIASEGLSSLAEINNGMCEEFAKDVCRIIPDAEARWDDEISGNDPICGTHKVIIHKGRYYDAQCPQGTTNYRELLWSRP